MRFLGLVYFEESDFEICNDKFGFFFYVISNFLIDYKWKIIYIFGIVEIRVSKGINII